MNHSLNIFLLTDDVKLVSVKFLTERQYGDAKHYTYKCFFPVKVGDLVVPYGAGSKGVAEVINDDVPVDFNSTNKYGWLMSKVDTETIQSILKTEEETTEKLREMELGNKRQQFRQMLGISNDMIVKLLPTEK